MQIEGVHIPTLLEAADDGSNEATLDVWLASTVYQALIVNGTCVYLDTIGLDGNEAVILLVNCSLKVAIKVESYGRLDVDGGAGRRAEGLTSAQRKTLWVDRGCLVWGQK